MHDLARPAVLSARQDPFRVSATRPKSDDGPHFHRGNNERRHACILPVTIRPLNIAFMAHRKTDHACCHSIERWPGHIRVTQYSIAETLSQDSYTVDNKSYSSGRAERLFIDCVAAFTCRAESSCQKDTNYQYMLVSPKQPKANDRRNTAQLGRPSLPCLSSVSQSFRQDETSSLFSRTSNGRDIMFQYRSRQPVSRLT